MYTFGRQTALYLPSSASSQTLDLEVVNGIKCLALLDRQRCLLETHPFLTASFIVSRSDMHFTVLIPKVSTLLVPGL